MTLYSKVEMEIFWSKAYWSKEVF